MVVPTNGELKIMFDNLEEKMEEKHHDVMDALSKIDSKMTQVAEQSTNTSGQVTQLFSDKKTFLWIVGALWTVILIGVPIGYAILRYIALNEIRNSSAQAVHEEWSKILSEYDISVIK